MESNASACECPRHLRRLLRDIHLDLHEIRTGARLRCHRLEPPSQPNHLPGLPQLSTRTSQPSSTPQPTPESTSPP